MYIKIWPILSLLENYFDGKEFKKAARIVNFGCQIRQMATLKFMSKSSMWIKEYEKKYLLKNIP